MTEWINVKDKVPKEDEWVLVYGYLNAFYKKEAANIYISKFNEDSNCFENEYADFLIADFWTPLPNAPKE